jgi:protein TonB
MKVTQRFKFNQISTLQWALLVSVGFHVVLLTLRFAAPETFNRVFQDTPLEVILVNSGSKDAPEKAQALAQFNLAGGGAADSGRATSPMAPSPRTELGDALEDTQRQQIEQMRQEQERLLSQWRRELARLAPPDTAQDSGDPQAQAAEEHYQQMVQTIAQIEKRINEQNERPKKRYISPATREVAYAVYHDGLRNKIENTGTQNFPQVNGRKLYGELVMMVTVDVNGNVVATEVVESSGDKQLDRRAEAIVRAAAPFGSFTPQMRAEADEIVVVSRFKFTKNDALETHLSNP